MSSSMVLNRLLGEKLRLLFLASGTVLFGLSLAGCGGATQASPASDALPTLSGADSDVSDSQDAEAPGLEQALEAFNDCLNEHDVDQASLFGSTGDIDEALSDPVVAEAMNSCGHLMADAADLTIDPDTQADLVDSSAAFAACARSVLNIDIPDDLFLLDPADPRASVLDDIEPTPEQERELGECAETTLEASGLSG